MPSFGENLRREREKRKITLDQISQSTKIGTRMLQALEEDKFTQLPGGIFNKGFVRAYARIVGLDEEQTIADYLQASGEAPPVMPEIPSEHPSPRIIEASAETPQRPLPWGLFAALLLVAALALSLWSRRQKLEHAADAPPQAVATRPAAQTAPSPTPGPTAARTDNATHAPATSATMTPSNSASTQTAAPLREPAAAPASAQPSSTTPVATAPSSSATPAAGGFLVNIQAREDSWTLITSDGRTVFSGMLIAGDQRTIRGQKEVVVRAGNAGAVDLFFNGKKVPAAGQFGEIKTITFGPAGVTPNAPPPSAPQ